MTARLTTTRYGIIDGFPVMETIEWLRIDDHPNAYPIVGQQGRWFWTSAAAPFNVLPSNLLPAYWDYQNLPLRADVTVVSQVVYEDAVTTLAADNAAAAAVAAAARLADAQAMWDAQDAELTSAGITSTLIIGSRPT